ncbi:hypothetical protein IWQ57_006626, partial [Coemansia nantahalensis]
AGAGVPAGAPTGRGGCRRGWRFRAPAAAAGPADGAAGMRLTSLSRPATRTTTTTTTLSLMAPTMTARTARAQRIPGSRRSPRQ